MSIATCIQSAMQEAGVVIAPAYIAGFSSIPRAAITPSTPVMLLGHKYLKLQKYYFSGFIKSQYMLNFIYRNELL